MRSAPDGTLYAAEMATGNTDQAPFVSPGTGRVVRQTGPDSLEEVVTGLDYPIAMAWGPDGAIYVGGTGEESGKAGTSGAAVLPLILILLLTALMAAGCTPGDSPERLARTLGDLDADQVADRRIEVAEVDLGAPALPPK